jgi:hypothetical protein
LNRRYVLPSLPPSLPLFLACLTEMACLREHIKC